ncbi:hypothetical protein T12_16821, partial [Trichinella patagoniensis]
MQFIIGSVFLITFHFSYRGISQKIGQDTSKDMEGIQKDSQMIKSDALHKQIAFYMPIDCHDLKTNGSKEWHVGNIIPLFKSSIFKSFMLNFHVSLELLAEIFEEPPFLTNTNSIAHGEK